MATHPSPDLPESISPVIQNINYCGWSYITRPTPSQHDIRCNLPTMPMPMPNVNIKANHESLHHTASKTNHMAQQIAIKVEFVTPGYMLYEAFGPVVF
jgi:hypothetical protein